MKIRNKFWASLWEYLLVILFFVVGTAFFFRNYLPTIDTSYGRPRVDSDGTLWSQWLDWKVTTTGEDRYFNNYLGYPFYSDYTLVPYLNLISPAINWLMINGGFSVSKLVLTNNLMMLIGYVLSGIFMYALSKYLTKSKSISLLVAFTYTFAFAHLILSRTIIANSHWEFYPLFFLFFLRFLDKNHWWDAALSIVVFDLMLKNFAYFAFFVGIVSIPIFIFYQRCTWAEIWKRGLIYYGALFLSLFILNYQFVFDMSRTIFSQSALETTGRSFADMTSNYTIPTLNYLTSPSLWSNNPGGLNFYLLLGAILAVILIKNRRVKLFFGCFLLCLAITVNLPILKPLHDLYFNFFYIFRGTGYIIGLLTFFVTLLFGYLVIFIHQSLTRRSPVIARLLVPLLLFFFFISFAVSYLGIEQTTNLVKYCEVFQPLKDDQTIEIVAHYPADMGFLSTTMPSNNITLAQLCHEKKMANGQNPFDPASVAWMQSIEHACNDETVDRLKAAGVDAIIYFSSVEDTEHLRKVKEYYASRSDLEFWYDAAFITGEGAHAEKPQMISVYRFVENNTNGI